MMRTNHTKEDKIYKKRKRYIQSYIQKIAVLVIFLIVLICIYNNTKPEVDISYEENSEVDYNVYLKDNEFYDNTYLEKDNQYIASLIKDIKAYFNYSLSLEEKDIDYNYAYRVEAELDVKEKNANNSLYKVRETLIPEKSFTKNSSSDLTINEQIDVDYNYYNNLIKKFISEYDLENMTSTLNINMYIKINDVWESAKNDEYIVSLVIPLTTKTVAIEIDSDLLNCREDLSEDDAPNNYFILALIAIITALILVFVIELIAYINKTKSAEEIYNVELKKILSNYGSYIQKVNNELNLNDKNVLWLDTFNDLLKVRDTIQEPILMIENEEGNETYFVILSKTNVIYAFTLKEKKVK